MSMLRPVDSGGLEMFAANLDKSSQVSSEYAKPTNQSLSRLIVSYSVRKSVRKLGFLTGAVSCPYEPRYPSPLTHRPKGADHD